MPTLAGVSRGQVQALLGADAAVGARDFVETYPGRDTSFTFNVLVAATLYVARVWPDHDLTITKLSWANGPVVSGTVEVGVMTSDGTTWTRIGTTGAVAQAGTSAVQTVTGLTIPVTRAAATYLYLIPSDAVGQYLRIITGSTIAGLNAVSPSGVLAGSKVAVGQPCPASVAGIAADARCLWLAGAV
jgi:hypothetical protein